MASGILGVSECEPKPPPPRKPPPLRRPRRRSKWPRWRHRAWPDWTRPCVRRWPLPPQADQADLVKRWETAHRGGVDDLKALRRFAFDLRRDQRAALARSLIESMVQALPDYAPLWTLLAELANKSRDPAEALRLGNEIHKRFPQSPHGPRVVLEAQLKLGELDDAAATLKNLPEAVRHSDWAFQAAVALAERRQGLCRHAGCGRGAG